MMNRSKNSPSTPRIVISGSSKLEKHVTYSPDCLRKSHFPKLSPANYDESLKLLSQSLEQICGKGSNTSLTNLSIGENSPKSPLFISTRPQSLHLTTLSTSPTLNYTKKDTDGSLLLKIRHDETREKLQQNLSKICSSTGLDSPSSVRKRISDAQENLKLKFRTKVDVSKQVTRVTNLFITLAPDRALTISHLTDTDLGSDRRSSVADLYSCKVPDEIVLEKILCSVYEGPTLYMRPSNYSFVEFFNTTSRHIPIMHIDEKDLTFTVTLRFPTEFSLENTVVTRIDETLIVKASGVYLSSLRGRMSQVESSLRFQIELPEDSEGRSLTARISPDRILIIKGSLLAASRRMTCKF